LLGGFAVSHTVQYPPLMANVLQGSFLSPGLGEQPSSCGWGSRGKQSPLRILSYLYNITRLSVTVGGICIGNRIC
jgi:hypothetical protein